jgi:hypothetical protein
MMIFYRDEPAACPTGEGALTDTCSTMWWFATVIVVLIACVLAAATAGAQVLNLARHDYASGLGARAIASADLNRDG